MNTNLKIEKLRNQFSNYKINGLVIPLSDEHQGEFVCPANKTIEWLTGFDCSAGLVLILEEEAIFFLDSRYYFQAIKHECAKYFTVINSSDQSPEEWLSGNCSSDIKIGAYAYHFSINQYGSIKTALGLKKSELLPLHEHPLFDIWENRPCYPAGPAAHYPIEYSGESSNNKIERLSKKLARLSCQATVINCLNDLAWLFNIRGEDVEFTPIVKGMGILQANGTATLFLAEEKISKTLIDNIDSSITIKRVEEFRPSVIKLAQAGCNFLIDRETSTEGIKDLILSSAGNIVEHSNIIATSRSKRNETEIKGARKAQLLDCVALARSFSWLENRLKTETITEYDVAQKLIYYRKETSGEMFTQLSFDSLVNAGPNATLGHYRPRPEKSRTLIEDELLLIDSGGQYLFSTTDITRTISFREPTDELKFRYSLILKGLISLSEALFPYGTCGMQLDTLAKQHLWQTGHTYYHGTGHGIGSYLGVHDGPQVISANRQAAQVAIEPGMVCANEPSFRIQGEYGMRIENDLLCIERTGENFNTSDKWLGFETLSYIPFDKKLIDANLYDDKEVEWINNYHQKTYNLLAPHLQNVDEEALKWLEENTQAIKKDHQ